MQSQWGRIARSLSAIGLVAGMVAGGGGAFSSAAYAQTEESFLSFVSQPGDYIGAGQSLTFTPSTAGFNSIVSDDRRSIGISVFPSSSFWYLNMAAPAGQELQPGVYEGATRWPFQAPPVPGLDFSGDGRGCNTLTGRFEVLEAVYAPFGYIERFHATFEQHCEGMEPALFGEVKIVNPPPPPPLTIDITIDPQGTVQRVKGVAAVSGTIVCSQPIAVQLNGTLTQRASRFVLASGSFSRTVMCSTEPTAWASAVSADRVPFNPGPAELSATASASDPNFGIPVTVQQSTLVQLKAARR